MNGYIWSWHVYNTERQREMEHREGQGQTVWQRVPSTAQQKTTTAPAETTESLNNNPLKMEMKKDLLSVDRRQRNAHVLGGGG